MSLRNSYRITKSAYALTRQERNNPRLRWLNHLRSEMQLLECIRPLKFKYYLKWRVFYWYIVWMLISPLFCLFSIQTRHMNMQKKERKTTVSQAGSGLDKRQCFVQIICITHKENSQSWRSFFVVKDMWQSMKN